MCSSLKDNPMCSNQQISEYLHRIGAGAANQEQHERMRLNQALFGKFVNETDEAFLINSLKELNRSPLKD